MRPKFRQCSIILKKPGYLTEKLKTLTSFKHQSLIVFTEIFANVSYLTMSIKGCSGFFLFCLHLEFFGKIEKTWFLQTQKTMFFSFLLKTRNLNKIKKLPNIFL